MRLWTEKERKELWRKDETKFAELAHDYPCCNLPAIDDCSHCVEFCKLNPKCGMDTIYTITMMRPTRRPRIVGWFDTFEAAEDAILNNVGDIHECDYLFCVIEEIPGGTVYPHPSSEQWYRWNKECYERIEKPDMYKRTVNFGIG